MIIKLDTREPELLKKLEYQININEQFKNIQIIVENLPLGDVIINDGETDIIILERKSLNDLSASIKDGRYEEQSYRLNGIDHHNHNIVYLIEGDINNKNNILFKDRVDKPTLYSAMVSIAFYKGFSVFRSFDMTETAYIICNMTYKIGKTKERPLYYSNNSNYKEQITQNPNENDIINMDMNISATSKNYCNVIKKTKKDNITKDNIGEIMLCQIPSISSQTALAILDKFKTINQLIKSIEIDSNCLNDICTIDSKNKSRKISKACINKILEFLKL